MSKSFEKVVTGLQRPVIFILMLIACPAMAGLGGWAFYEMGYPVIFGDKPLKEGVSPLLAYSVLAVTCLIPLLLSWVSFRYAKKAWYQMKNHGVIYK